MKEAKHCYLLSNGVSVVPGDRVELITNDGEKYIGDIIDISAKNIWCKLLDGVGEVDMYFEELRDVVIIKQS